MNYLTTESESNIKKKNEILYITTILFINFIFICIYDQPIYDILQIDDFLHLFFDVLIPYIIKTIYQFTYYEFFVLLCYIIIIVIINRVLLSIGISKNLCSCIILTRLFLIIGVLDLNTYGSNILLYYFAHFIFVPIIIFFNNLNNKFTSRISNILLYIWIYTIIKDFHNICNNNYASSSCGQCLIIILMYTPLIDSIYNLVYNLVYKLQSTSVKCIHTEMNLDIDINKKSGKFSDCKVLSGAEGLNLPLRSVPKGRPHPLGKRGQGKDCKGYKCRKDCKGCENFGDEIIQKFCLNHNMTTNIPYIIGISGGSGSGKTVISEIIVKTIKKTINGLDVIVISQDSYYKGGDSETNYDIPSAIDFDLLIKNLQLLIKGQKIENPVYDFKTHNRMENTIEIHPQKIIIVEGILIFTQEKLRKLFDMKIFVHADLPTQVFRRTIRDVEERGRSLREVQYRYERDVCDSYNKFVLPYSSYADMIINNNNNCYTGIEILLNHINIKIKNINS